MQYIWILNRIAELEDSVDLIDTPTIIDDQTRVLVVRCLDNIQVQVLALSIIEYFQLPQSIRCFLKHDDKKHLVKVEVDYFEIFMQLEVQLDLVSHVPW